MDNATAKQIATNIINVLKPACARIEIAGSLRRGKPEVKDIEIVCVPADKRAMAVFGKKRAFESMFEELVSNWAATAKWSVRKNGARYKQFESKSHGIKLDLFIVRPPAQWGVIYAIRTGPAEFSQWLVTAREKGGALPEYTKVEHGGVYAYNAASDDADLLPMSEEIHFLDFLGLGWMEPHERVAHWGMFQKERVR